MAALRFPHAHRGPRAVGLRTWPWSDAASDVVVGVRSLIRSWRLSAVVVAMFALGFGVNGSVFAILYEAFLQQPAGVPAPGQLRRLWLQQPKLGGPGVSARDAIAYHFYRAIAQSAVNGAEFASYVTRAEIPVEVRGSRQAAAITYATANFFSVLRVQPREGRVFDAHEADVNNPTPVAVISDAFRQREFGGTRAVLGKEVTIDHRPYTIVGVTPPGFAGVDLQRTDIWVPLSVYPTRQTARVPFWESSVVLFPVIARLRDGTDVHAVERAATEAFRHAPLTDFPAGQKDRVFLRSIVAARGLAPLSHELSLTLRLGAVALIILLISGANVANLLGARAVERSREMAVRSALGASRGRLVRLCMVESMLLVGLAGVAALWVGHALTDLLQPLLLPGIHLAHPGGGTVLAGIMAVLVVVVGTAVSVTPALNASRPNLAGGLSTAADRHGTARAWRREVLVAVQTALSVVLVIAAGLLVATARNIQNLRIGFDVQNLAFGSVQLPSGEMPDTGIFSIRMREAGRELLALPGVTAVAFAQAPPMTDFGMVRFYTASDSSDLPGRTLPTANYVSADYFRATGTRLLKGRVFTDAAGSSANAVVINKTLADAYWPHGGAIGACIHINMRESPCVTVVGIVGDAIRDHLTETFGPQLFLPIFTSSRGQKPPRAMIVRVRPGYLDRVAFRMSDVLHGEFPSGEPRVIRMEDQLAPQYRPWRLGAVMFTMLGVLGLAIAAIGVYGAVEYSVVRQLREIGIRLALGATRSNIVRQVVLVGIRPVAGGLAVGVVAILAGGRIMSSVLYDVAPRNFGIIGGSVLVLLIVGAVAAFVPARRGASIDPMRSLQSD